MLIENAVKIGDVVSFKITTGEEIIGKLKEISPSQVTLSNPHVVSVQMTQQGLGIAMPPFIFSGEDKMDVIFNMNNIISKPVRTKKEISNSYLEMTTGIAIPKSGLIT